MHGETVTVFLGRPGFTTTQFSESLTNYKRKILRDFLIFSAIHKISFINALKAILVMNKHNTLSNAIHANRHYTKSQWTTYLMQYLTKTTNRKVL